MNLSLALDQSLPELPAQQAEKYPTFNPRTIAREHKEPNRTVVMAMAPGTGKVLYLSPDQWILVQLFNGRRSFEDISREMKRRAGVHFPADDIRKFSEQLDGVSFWYKTPQEESITLMNQLVEQRRKRKQKRKASDLYKTEVVSFDPDRFFNWLKRWTEWAFTPWFTALSFLGIVLMLGIWISNWGEIWHDTLQYYNFTEKTFGDIVEFYLMFTVMAFFHESGHALTAKHFGAEIHKMGLMLIYTSPAVFVDSSEVWLYGGRRERGLTILAGLWVEMLFCGVLGTLVWWATTPDSFVHDIAYKFILIGAMLPLIVNLNPLMRLDGYLFLCEMIRTPGLKERCIAFFSSWLRKHIFHLPVTVPYLPRRRAIAYSIYAVLAGAYSYLVLLFLSRLTYRIMLHFTPDWAFLFAALVALRIFKSRILKFVEFMKTLYLDKREWLLAHRTPLLAAGAVAVLVLCLPLKRETVKAPFILEPAQRAVLRAATAGRVADLRVDEGQWVQAGDLVARLRDLQLESAVAQAQAFSREADARARQARLQYVSYAAAEREEQRAAEQARILLDRQQRLTITSPIAGVVVTPRVRNLLDTYVVAGTVIAEVDDLSTMRASVYVPETEIRTLDEVRGNVLHVRSQLGSFRGQLLSIAPTSDQPPDGLMPANKLKGIKPPPFYVATFLVPNPGLRLRSGETGTAKIQGARESVAGMILKDIADFLGRKIW